jgi:hypothetical protein
MAVQSQGAQHGRAFQKKIAPNGMHQPVSHPLIHKVTRNVVAELFAVMMNSKMV